MVDYRFMLLDGEAETSGGPQAAAAVRWTSGWYRERWTTGWCSCTVDQWVVQREVDHSLVQQYCGSVDGTEGSGLLPGAAVQWTGGWYSGGPQSSAAVQWTNGWYSGGPQLGAALLWTGGWYTGGPQPGAAKTMITGQHD